ncbi:MAG TPA: aminotransferase class I/II-fold pyridoxal phosphate-dependent enzyme [Dehalococcoidales bacterium]|nr:aminotransferase class I/II-fold pyridoxal phosphate-dependent enzyme [Dehalococcoidales bacterium]
MQFDNESLAILAKALKTLEQGFEDLPEVSRNYNYSAISTVIQEIATKMQDNYPYFHPFYAGQMLKPPHPVARIAYMLSLWINPNNHAIDGGRASSQMEKEAVAEIAGMFGWSKHLGHLTSGGTVANLEALWISGKQNPDKLIVASEMAHYTHSRISEVLRLPFQSVPCNERAVMDLDALEKLLKTGAVGTVVATLGATGTGRVDPLPEIVDLKEKYGFRLHADAAYGGYFTLIENLSPTVRRAFDYLNRVDSIVVDPHKHGLQPYGCGCVLFSDPAVGRFYKHDSPYTYFSSNELHLGEISLECSRAGASAVALWATQKLLPMVRGGEFATGLSRCRQAGVALYDRIKQDDRFRTIIEPDLDIVVWAPAADTEKRISELSQSIFERAANYNLHLATFKYPSRLLKHSWQDIRLESEFVSCLRSCLMKPEHLDWLDSLWAILVKASNESRRQ